MTVIKLLQGYRIVKIAGVHRVNRDHRLTGQVEAALNRFVEAIGFLAGLGEGVLGKFVGQVEFADDRQRIDALPALRTEDFDNYAFSVVHRRRETERVVSRQ